MPGRSNTTVKTTFTLKDQLSKGLKRISKNVRLFGDRSEKSFKRASLGALKFKTIIGGILGAGVLTRGFFELRRGVRALTEEVISFDDAITHAAAKFPEGIKRGSKEFAALGARAREVAADTKFTATESAKALDFMAFAGFSANQAMALLPKTTELATVGALDLGRATDIATDALGAFNLRANNTSDLTKNLSRINNVFAKTITTSNTNLEQLFEGLKQAGPVATAAGVSLEKAAAITGTLANAGIKGSLAGTQLKNMFLRLTATTPKSEKQLAKLGVTVSDSAGNMRDFFDIVQDFEIGLKGMGSAQKSMALNTIFGRRAVVGMNNILNAGSKNLRRYERRLINSGGAAQNMATEIEKSLGNQLLKLKSAAIELGLKFFDAFGKKMPGAIDDLIKAFRNFDPEPVFDSIREFITLMKGIKNTIEILSPIIFGIIAPIALLKTAIMGVTAVQWLWNVALTANPIGLIIVGIGALIGVIITLSQNWSSAMAFMDLASFKFQVGFKNVVNNVIEWANDMIEAFNMLSSALGLGLRVDKIKKLKVSDKIQGFMEQQLKQNLLAAKIAESGDLTAKQKRALVTAEGGLTRGAKAKFFPEDRQAPNQGKVNAAQQQQSAGFDGKITLAGAPKGTTFEGKTRGPANISPEVLGAN